MPLTVATLNMTCTLLRTMWGRGDIRGIHQSLYYRKLPSGALRAFSRSHGNLHGMVVSLIGVSIFLVDTCGSLPWHISAVKIAKLLDSNYEDWHVYVQYDIAQPQVKPSWNQLVYKPIFGVRSSLFAQREQAPLTRAFRKKQIKQPKPETLIPKPGLLAGPGA